MEPRASWRSLALRRRPCLCQQLNYDAHTFHPEKKVQTNQSQSSAVVAKYLRTLPLSRCQSTQTAADVPDEQQNRLMRPFRLAGRWGSQILPLGTRPPICHACFRPLPLYYSQRLQSGAAAAQDDSIGQPVKRRRGRPRKNEVLQSNVAAVAPAPAHVEPEEDAQTEESQLDTRGAAGPPSDENVKSERRLASPDLSDESSSTSPPQTPRLEEQPSDQISLESLPSPPSSLAPSSAKLAALHARLALPSRLNIETLARCLIDRTADPDPRFNNNALSQLGNDLLGYYTAEYLLVYYPRLPFAVLTAAQWAYVGVYGLSTVAQSWGVEAAAEPGGEVDPGLLQFRRTPPGTVTDIVDKSTRPQDRNRRGDKVEWRRGQSSRVVYDDPFGDPVPAPDSAPAVTATLDHAACTFVRAVAGAVYLHAGGDATYQFFESHIRSRQLDIASMFTFTAPTRDLSRLCAREGFQSPVARLESESGRHSRHPVFVVGVYSGRDKLGEGAGASLDEARFRAAVTALKGWYLYSPVHGAGGGEVILPSAMEREEGKGKDFKEAFVDCGEVIA